MTELVVLLDEQGQAVGTADKATVHHQDTPLHLAFSCYVFDGAGSVLVTQRAHTKVTWPGVWTNACCGHPGPGEPIEDAVRRRVRDELGIELQQLVLLLPGFRYRAEMLGVVEHEMCPVFAAVSTDSLRPDPAEVADAAWESWDGFRSGVLDGTRAISPWCRDQVAALPAEPWTAPAAAADGLPPAARRPGR
ncbi:isopentenyl-diphosphate Delta-isomerase [Nocardioides currus]|uniref:Isopentenyl-diphosphate Delta-isomerase n=1 Tax=Nocardioides currus TaxID=2133958 RepID=A0A2R7YV17_9ACTN|nr:isopentenyl-diphosphate Delta-isomerase [Nocardioides currus]PUA80144.1 isopentenyl-diphosphate delta-isomerase [Nocardioides currus]